MLNYEVDADNDVSFSPSGPPRKAYFMAGPRGFEPRISGFPLLSGGLRAISWRPLDALIQTGLRANRKEADPGFSLSLADPLDDGGLRDFKDFYEALTDIRMKVLFLFYATSGLRKSEALELRKSDVDLALRQIVPHNHKTDTTKNTRVTRSLMRKGER